MGRRVEYEEFDLLEVLPDEHPDFDYVLGIDHVIAHVREDLIEQLEADLSAHPDVLRVFHEDRGTLLVASRRKLLRRRLSAEALEAWARAWFARYSQDELYPPDADW